MSEMAKNDYRSRCWHWKFTCPCFLCIYPLGLRVLRGHNNYVNCVTWMEEVYCGTMAQMKEKKTKKRTDEHSTPHGSAGCRHRFFTVTFLEDKVRPIPHLCRTYTVPPKQVSTGGGLMKEWNECAIVVTVCALTDTTDCNWDMTSTSFLRRGGGYSMLQY